MSRIHLLLLLLLAVVAVPFAAADNILLTGNNLGITGQTIATVNLTAGTDHGKSGVWVTITAGSNYSIKLQGGPIMFNSSATLKSSNILDFTADGFATKFAFGGTTNRAGFTFNYDISKMNKGSLPTGHTSADQVKFFISGVTVSQLEVGNPSWGLHFCVGAGTSCGKVTGFATNGPNQVTVPEPGTLSLLGTGLFGLATFARRRFFS